MIGEDEEEGGDLREKKGEQEKTTPPFPLLPESLPKTGDGYRHRRSGGESRNAGNHEIRSIRLLVP